MFYWVILAALAIASLSGFWGIRQGYSFWRQFITGFIASVAILSTIVKLVKEYF
ncbi:hypothetical protein [Putridiphycobacter roseus]|uniref:hypothetical protein n=1 Tax=Putridiphycobacter roseus TaxID=2219161 RepID=UPI0013149637|nr:hypothetical protein [Putridiphycobacter roseus]